MFYTKICPVCSKAFDCMRLSQLYCSKLCNNRAQRLPRSLRTSLVNRVQRYTMNATRYTANARNDAGEMELVGDVADGVTKEHPLGKDEGFLLALVKLEAENRKNRQRQDIKDAVKMDQENRYSDPEMKVLHKEIGKDENLGDRKTTEYVLNSKTGATLIAKEPVKVIPPVTIDPDTGFHFDLGENIEPITEDMIDPEMRDFVLEDNDIITTKKEENKENENGHGSVVLHHPDPVHDSGTGRKTYKIKGFSGNR